VYGSLVYGEIIWRGVCHLILDLMMMLNYFLKS